MSSVASPSLPETGRRPKFRSRLADSRFSPDGESRQESRAIRRGFSSLAVGNIVNAACSWGRVALLARWGNAEMIGQLTLALAVCNPISTFADLGLCGSLISDAQRHFRLRDYLALRAITCALTLAVIAAAACVGYEPAGARLIVLAGVLVVLESTCDIFQAVLQREERMQWVGVSLTIRSVLGLAIFAAAICVTRSLVCGVCGLVVAAVVTLIVIDIPQALACEKRSRLPHLQFQISDLRSQISNLRSHISDWRSQISTSSSTASGGYEPITLCVMPQFAAVTSNCITQGVVSTKVLIHLAWLSLPLGLATASLSLSTSIPRCWISARLGNTSLGGFAVAGSLMIAMSLVVGALSQAAAPRLARYHAGGDRAAFRRLLGRLSLWLAVATVLSVAVMAIAGRLVIALLFGPDFVPYTAVATCLMLAAGLRNFSILLGRAITSMRRFRTALVLRLLGIAVLVLLLPGWIDWLGLLGAAWAVTLSWLITTLLSLAVVLRFLECDGLPSLFNTRNAGHGS